MHIHSLIQEQILACCYNPLAMCNSNFGLLMCTFACMAAAMLYLLMFSAMQIRLYFPETGHPAYGILRAIVKDSNNTNNITSYLDSDGQVANDYESDADSTPYRRQFLADGLWHMVTLSTLTSNASGLRGFAMLLDGRLVGIEAADTLYISESSIAGLHLPLQVRQQSTVAQMMFECASVCMHACLVYICLAAIN